FDASDSSVATATTTPITFSPSHSGRMAPSGGRPTFSGMSHGARALTDQELELGSHWQPCLASSLIGDCFGADGFLLPNKSAQISSMTCPPAGAKTNETDGCDIYPI